MGKEVSHAPEKTKSVNNSVPMAACPRCPLSASPLDVTVVVLQSHHEKRSHHESSLMMRHASLD